MGEIIIGEENVEDTIGETSRGSMRRGEMRREEKI